MLRATKNQLSVPLLAITVLALAPAAAHAEVAGDISIAQVLNTSPLWADAQSYHACNVVNVSTSAVNISIELTRIMHRADRSSGSFVAFG